MEWMTGGAACADVEEPGWLASMIPRFTTDWVLGQSAAARARAETMFSTDTVIGEYLAYYAKVLAA